MASNAFLMEAIPNFFLSGKAARATGAQNGRPSKILFRLQRFTSAIRRYRVGLTLLGSTRRGGLEVIEYFAIYFAVFTVLTLTLIH
jgi:hypothetical protein